MNDKVYDILKYIQRIGLPALLTMILTIGQAGGADLTIVGTIGGAVIAFLGVVLQGIYMTWEENNELSQ